MKKIKKRKIIIITVIVIILSLFLSVYIYVNDYYKADLKAISIFSEINNVYQNKIDENKTIYYQENSTYGLIFYPGGKVEALSYEPLMKLLASKGITCVLVEMPFNLAVFDINAADGIKEKYPHIDNWYMAGHSLGGAMAANYISSHDSEFSGLILLGAYATKDLSDTTLNVLSIYGSEDKILNKKKYEQNKQNLPDNFKEEIIVGGIHSYFGMYGNQDGDGIPKITNQEQITLTAEIISDYIYT